MEYEWTIKAKIIDKKARRRHKPSLVYETEIDMPTDLLTPCIKTIVLEMEKKLSIWKEVYYSKGK